MNTEFDDLEFKNPSSKFRGAPFWSWNSRLDKDTLKKQIAYFKEMGFGGFHMHPRTGLNTEYLGKEFMECVGTCIEEAKQEGMKAYLYDEDRWPSGFAGGYVTKNPEYRARHLLLTPFSYEEHPVGKIEPNFSTTSFRTGNGKLLACYDIVLDENKCLESYERIDPKEKARGTRWYAYLETALESPWFNGQTYVDTMNKAAIDEFLRCTHKKYHEEFGEYFGDLVPSIFCDEPQLAFKTTLGFAEDKADLILMWTDDFPKTFQKTYGEDILKHLPQLFWELPRNRVSKIRYCYYDHVAERLVTAFADNIRSWCAGHNLKMTGHMVAEGDLNKQTNSVGDVMRAYRGFDLPGVDILRDVLNLDAVKCAQSVSHQNGCGGLLSEPYGVTNWDFDFRAHKFQGDWTAALGVTFRALHLSMYSMEGEAKRDYPASLNYQSPWFREYKQIEDHYARINTQMTKGAPVVKVGVINPIETFWLYNGSNESTGLKKEKLVEDYNHIVDWLLFGAVDFDFISEALLKNQCGKIERQLHVGQMGYDTILVPSCETVRETTWSILSRFMAAGGNVIFAGGAPKYIDAKAASFPENLNVIPFDRDDIINALEKDRTLYLFNRNGTYTDNLIYSLRQDGCARYLFIAHAKRGYSKDISKPQHIKIQLKGNFIPSYMDTLTGKVREMEFTQSGDNTEIPACLYDNDSLLLKLTEGVLSGKKIHKPETAYRELKLPELVDYQLSEPNVLLLDMAEYALDDEALRPCEEILRIDKAVRGKLGLPLRMDVLAQPWSVKAPPAKHRIKLRYTIQSEIDCSGAMFAVEHPENLTIRFNGVKVPTEADGFYVDESIKKISLPTLTKGENVLVIELPFGELTNLEACYLLGEFGVTVRGTQKVVTPLPAKLAFGDVTNQGFAFYGGNITYQIPVKWKGRLEITVPQYRGALVGVGLNGQRQGSIIFPPYKYILDTGEKSENHISLTLFGNRVNTFGTVHYADEKDSCASLPNSWRSQGNFWCYEYRLKPFGILVSPVLRGEQA